MVQVAIKPCPYLRNPDPRGHKVQVLPEDLADMLEYSRAQSGFRVVCTCTMRGPVAGDPMAAIAVHNSGLP